jgi:hypothetical protein
VNSSSDWKNKEESFDMVALHSYELHNAALAIKIDPKVFCKLLQELKFIAECMGVPLPLIPVLGEDEAKFFLCLVLARMDKALHVDYMALEWCKLKVGGWQNFPSI